MRERLSSVASGSSPCRPLRWSSRSASSRLCVPIRPAGPYSRSSVECCTSRCSARRCSRLGDVLLTRFSPACSVGSWSPRSSDSGVCCSTRRRRRISSRADCFTSRSDMRTRWGSSRRWGSRSRSGVAPPRHPAWVARSLPLRSSHSRRPSHLPVAVVPWRHFSSLWEPPFSSIRTAEDSSSYRSSCSRCLYSGVCWHGGPPWSMRRRR